MNEDKIVEIYPEIKKISIKLMGNLAELSGQLMKGAGLTRQEQDFCSTVLVSHFITYYVLSMEAFGKVTTGENIYKRKKLLKMLYYQVLEIIEDKDTDEIAVVLSKIKLRDLQ